MGKKRPIKPENLPPDPYDDEKSEWSLAQVGILCGVVLGVFIAGWIGWKTLDAKGLAGVAMFVVIFGLLKLAEIFLIKNE